MNSISTLNRRDFIKVASATGAGLVISFYLPGAGRLEAAAGLPDAPFVPNAWLRIDKSGIVTILVGKSEMGQGIRTALPMIVAEELEADWSTVRIEQAVADKKYGSMGTGGSTSVRTSWDNLRKAGATARELLLAAAAQTWGVEKSSCRAEKGTVIHTPTNRTLKYGELVEKASALTAPKDVPLKDPKDYRIVGKSIPRLDTPGKVDGSAVFGLDVRVPGMLYATVARCPVFGGKVARYDATKAKSIAGVQQVVQIDSGIAVIANSTWAAMKGRDALEITWDIGSNAGLNSAAIHKMLEEAAPKSGAVAEREGDAASAIAQAKKKVEATYEAPFLAHATMEPMNCVAHVQKDRCEIWAPTQDPQGAQKDGASIAGMDESKVTVHTTLMGGGFGRRFDNDFVREALHASKAAGAPVQVVWTREDDMQHDGYRPVSLHRLAGSLDEKGQLTALMHKIVAPSISGSYWPNIVKDGLDKGAVEGAVELPYSIPNSLVEFVMANNAVPIWFWRSVYPSQNVFALECFIDELAHAAGKDPYEFRRQLMTKAPRTKAALELAAEKSGWEKPLPKGRYRGIACSPPSFFQTPVVQVAEVSVSPAGVVRVHRVVCAVDCGIVINPDTATAQMEGGIVYGLTAALKGEITIDKGRTVQSNFDDYPLLTIDEMPEVEVHFVKSTNPPSGTGEPGLPAIAPAVANAVFAATGKRVRQLPIRMKA